MNDEKNNLNAGDNSLKAGLQKKRRSRFSVFQLVGVLVMVVLLIVAGFMYLPKAHAATNIWQNGGVDHNYSTAGNWSLGHKPAAGEDVVISAAWDMVMDEGTALVKSWDMTGYTGTLSSTFGISVGLNIAGTTVCLFAGTITWTGILAFYPNNTDSIINFTSGTLTPRSITATSIGNGKVVQQDGIQFADIAGNRSLTLSGTMPWEMNNQTLYGGATFRLLITSSTKGTSSVIQLNGGAAGSATKFRYIDARDILFQNGGSDLDLSAITGLSGDALGNGMSGGGSLTFTPSVAQIYSGVTGNYSNDALWTSRSPLPQDDVTIGNFGGAGRTLTFDKWRIGRNIDLSGLTSAANKPTVGTSAASTQISFYGSLTLASTTYLTWQTNNWSMSWEGRTNSNLTTAGQSFVNGFTIVGTGATLQMQDALTVGFAVNPSGGTLDTQGYSILCGSFSSGTGPAKSVIGTGSITMTGNIATTFNISTVLMTWSHTGDLNFTYNGATNTIFNFGTSRTLANKINITGGGAGIITMTAATAATFTGKVTVGAPKTVKFTSGVTYNFADISLNGSAGNVITMLASTGGSAATLNYTGTKRAQVMYGDITDINVTPANTWYYDSNSVWHSGTGWVANTIVVKTFGAVAGNWSDATKWIGGVKPVNGDDVVLDALSGNVAVDENTANLRSIDASSYAGTSSSSFTIIVKPTTGITVDVKLGGTWNFAGSISLEAAHASAIIRLTTNGKQNRYYYMEGGVAGGKVVLQDACTLAGVATNNFNITPSQATLDLNGQTLSGNNGTTFRGLLKSNTLGTSATILVNGGTFANMDFMDIGFNNGGADLNLSGITGNSGDAGGNSMVGGGNLTFTSGQAQTWNGTTGNWSDTAKWSGGRSPLPQDDVVLAGTNTVTANMARIGKSISFTGATPLTLSNNVTSYGSINFTNSGTISGVYNWVWSGRGSYLLTSAGKAFPGEVYISGVGGTLTAQDATTIGTAGAQAFRFTDGTFDGGVFAIATAQPYAATAGTTRAINGSGAWTISSSIYLQAANLTWNATGPMTFTYTGATERTLFFGTSRTMVNNITINTSAAIAYIQATTAVTFNGLVTVNSPKTVKFTSGVTYNFNGGLNLNGSAGNLVTVVSSTPASAATWSKASGLVFIDYASIQDIAATGGATWYVTANVTEVSGTSGFTSAIPNGIWDGGGGANTNWSTAANWSNDTLPISTTDTYFAGTTTNATVDAGFTGTIKSLTLAGSYANTITNAKDLTITDDVSLNGGTWSPATYTISVGGNWVRTGGTFTYGTSTVKMTNTAGTKNVTSGGMSFYNFTVDGVGGTTMFTDTFATPAAGTLTLTNGTLNTNNQAVNIGFLASSSSNTRTLQLGSSSVTLSGSSASVSAWETTTVTGLTVSANTAIATFTGAGTAHDTFSSGGKDFNGLSLVFSGSGVIQTTTGSCTFQNLTRTGTAAKTDGLTLNGNNRTINGTFTVNGNSASNRVLVSSTSLGGARTITAAAVVLSNVDFMDITFARTMALTSYASIGDAGGNSGTNWSTIVTAPATQTWNGTTGNWSDNTKWTSRVPLPQDDVVLSGTNTVTVDEPRIGKSISFTGATSLTLSNGVTNYGSLDFTNSGTLTMGALGTNRWNFAGRGNYLLTSAGKDLTAGFGGYMVGGKITAQDATVTGYSITHQNGEFDFGSYPLSFGSYSILDSAAAKTVSGSGPITITATNSTSFSLGTTQPTWNHTGPITLAYSGASDRTYNFGTSRTFANNITISGTGAGIAYLQATTAVTFTGKVTVGAPKTVKFTSGVTYNFADISLNGSAGSVITLLASTGGSAATLNYTGTTRRAQLVYGDITDINVTPASTWYYDSNSVWHSGTGWTSGIVVKTFGAVAGNWSDAAKWIGGIKPIAQDDVVFDALSASCVVDETTASLRSLDASTYTGSVTGSNELGVWPSTAGTFDAKMGGTWSSYTGNLSIGATHASGLLQLTSNGTLVTNVTIYRKVQLQDNVTFSTNALIQFRIATTASLDMNGKTISGNNSTTSRILLASRTLGTSATVLVNGGTFANMDFMDIGFNNGGADLNLSAITGNSGDAGGNSMVGGGALTFTGAATQTWDGTTGNWSDTAKWSGGRSPLPQDDVVLAGTNTVTANMLRIGKSISFSAAAKLTLGNDLTSYGSLNFTNSGTFTRGSYNWTFGGRGNYLLTSAGRTPGYTQNIAAPGGSMTAQDATVFDRTFTITAGNFDCGIYSYSGGGITGAATIAAQLQGSGSLTISGTVTNSLFLTGSAFTWAHTGVLNLTYNDTSNRTYNFGTSRTIANNITITGGGSGQAYLAATTAVTFTGLVTVNSPKTVKFTSGVTYNFAQKPVLTGTAGNLITMLSSTPGVSTTLNYTGTGLILVSYADITDINVTPNPPATWYYDGNSAYHSGTGWSTDTTAPSVLIVVDPASPNGLNGWYTGAAPTITLSATDGGSGLAAITYRWNADATQTYTVPLTAPTGTNTLTYFATDNIGNASTPATPQYKVDLAAPTTDIHLTPTDPDGTNGWYKTIPSITFTGADSDSTFQSAYYRWGAVGDFTIYTTALAPAEGTNTIYYYGIDVAGNQTDTFDRTIKLDHTIPIAPTYVGVTPTGYSHDNHFVFTWPVDPPDGPTDTGTSGLAKFKYRIGASGAYTDIAGDATTATLTLDDAATLGLNTFNLVAVDTAGNQSNSVRTNFYFNNTAPLAPANLTVDPLSNTANLFSFDWDASPGEIAGYYYSVNAIPTLANAGWTASLSLSSGAYATQQGQNIMYVVAKDNAGNYDFSGCGPASVGYNSNTDTCAAVAFTTNTTAPGLPGAVEIYDISVRATNEYSVALKWTPPTDTGTGFAGYEIYRSEDGIAYTLIGETTGTTYADNNVVSQIYFYKLKSYDNADQYSAFTSPVQITPTGRFTTPCVLVSGPTFTINPTSIDIAWATDRECSSFVTIKDGNTFVGEQGQTEQVTAHSVKVVGLRAQNDYTFNVSSTDVDGNVMTGSDQSFITANTPSVYDLTLSNLTQSSVIVNFKSSVIANFTLYYGETSDYGESKAEITGNATTNHSLPLNGLKSGQTYFYRVLGEDSEGNELRSENSFATLPMPSIEKFAIEPVKDAPSTTLKVTWKTNVNTTTILKYSTDGTNFTEKDTADLVTDHEIIVEDLKDQSQYVIYGAGRDQFGNMATSNKITFNTPADSRAPVISDIIIEASNIGNSTNGKAQVFVSWKTDEAANSQVEYDTGISGDTYNKKTLVDETYTNQHLVIISDLEPGKPYHLRVVSIDLSDNVTVSTDNTVITGEVSKSALQLILNTLMNIFGWMGKLIK